MVDRHKTRKGEIYFSLSPEESSLFACRYPVDFLKLSDNRQKNTHHLDPKTPIGQQHLARFEAICENLGFEIRLPRPRNNPKS